MRRLRWLGSAVIAIAAAGCTAGSGAPSAPSPPSNIPPGAESPAGIPETAPAASASASPAASASAEPSAIVGEWVAIQDCQRIITMLADAGLDEFVLEQVYEFVPGVAMPEDLKDPTKPCDGAVERQHSHFFTADGAFGSKDFNGEEVDDGTYELEGDDVLVINGSRFHYRVDGDKLTLEPEPVDTSACTTKLCRFGAAWVLMVAMPGTTWTRGEIPSA